MGITVRNLQKRFGDFVALDNVSLDFPPGELVALLGPSGCGKTTLLRVIAGLEYADGGQVVLQGQDVATVGAREREVGFVFQHYALFRHMTVFENVAFGLRVKPRKERPSEAVIREKVHELLKLVQLDWLAQRYPSELSGGQRQRIALARALAVEPKVLLLDEPFGALDAKVRKELRSWLRRLHDDLHISTIFVTHDQEEALELADRVAVMNNGRVEQVGSPEVIYQQPATPFVCEFIGKVNRFTVRRNGSGLAAGGWMPQDDPWQGKYTEAVAYVRPEQLRLAVPTSQPAWETRLRHIYLAGSVAHLELHVGSLDQTLEADVASEDLSRLGLHPGMEMRVAPRGAVLFPRNDQGVTINHERWIWHARSPVPA